MVVLRKFLSVFILLLFVTITYFYDNFYVVSNYLNDQLIKETRESYEPIVLLTIDDQSLHEIGRWPWQRDILANVADQLAANDAKAVFVDVLYTEDSPQPSEDAVWREVLAKNDNIYLPIYFQLDNRQKPGDDLSYEYINYPIYEQNQNNEAHINAWEDRDRVVRQVILGIDDENGEMIPAMSVLLANKLLSNDRKITWNEQSDWFIGAEKISTDSFNKIYFSYASTPTSRSFETLSIHRVINGEIDPAYFQDKIVLIGPYAVGFQDTYFVPGSNTQMYGVEIHANIVQSFLDGFIYQKSSDSMGILIIIVLTIATFMTMERLSARWSLIALGGFIIGYFLIVYAVFTYENIILPLFYPILAIFLTYITSLVSQYIKERLERNRVTGLFGKYVAKSVVDEILANTDEIKLGGERKDVTLLFIDIRGFTPLSEKMEPEEVIIILNDYLDLCTKAIFKFDGTVDKFMGDGVMAIFGAPVPQDDHPERAIRATLALKEEAEGLATRLQEKYGRSVRFGMGINTGPAVIGNIGSQDRLEYTAIGDTVNLAARLESNAKPGQILISENTFQRIEGKFLVTPLEPIKVKGKEELVQIYQVEGENE